MTNGQGETATGASLTIGIEEMGGLEYRCVGPHRGGRVVAVAGHPTDPMTFYFGACAGGVWKTTDGGTYWHNISDGYFSTAAIGALAVSESDPNVIYAGTGETTIRSNVSHGDGVYRSTDGGKSWQNVGLRDTRHIAKIRIHPRNPDIVYVAALGHAWGPNEERGVFRSRDGGKTWEKILFKSERAGAIDLSMDPTNPRILYAAIWEAGRTPYGFTSGGPECGLYRTTDGGDTWTDITRNEGLPQGTLGKIGVAVSPAKPDRVWALIEAEDGALFRSDNGGDSWQMASDNADLRRRAWYYMHLFADPQDEDVVWVLNLQTWKSVDGGKNFTSVPTPHGDNHDLWIDPRNTERLIEGNDGGACVSYNGGYSWSTILNQPTAQFYHVTADSATPYRVYGSQQDNTAISVPSLSVHGAITQTDWFVPGGGESGYIAVRPDNPDIQYAGDHRGLLTRHDRRTGQRRVIDVWPEFQGMYEGAESLRHRFQWTFPIFLSPFDPTVLYVAAERLFRSTDEGASWEAISPDLTRNAPHTLGPAGGAITRDNTSAEVYATIFAAVESPHQQGLFWVGTDDGLVHISRDGGESWEEITPPALKTAEGEWALISTIDLSAHDPGTAYLAATRYKLDDTRPYLFKTNDYGATWQAITDGIPDGEFTRVVREDPNCRGLLFAGTETGLYLSFDDGAHWERLQTNLPVCPIHDLIVHNNDLVVGTHGRSFWILDDISPLQQMTGNRNASARLFTPRDTIRFKVYEGFSGGEGDSVMYRMAGPVTYAYTETENREGTKEKDLLDAGKNPPTGVILTYYLPEKPQGEITLTIENGDGALIRTFSSKKETEEGEKAGAEMETPTATTVEGEAAEGSEVLVDPEADEAEQQETLPRNEGINRFTWDFRAERATAIPGDKSARFTTAGPEVPPGTYRARLQVNGESYEASFHVLKDPRVSATEEDLRAQYDLGQHIRDAISRINTAVIEMRDIREQLDGWDRRLARRDGAEDARRSIKRLKDRLTSIEEELLNTKSTSRMGYPPPNVPTRLSQKLAMLRGVVGSADAAPTKQSREVFEELSRAVDEQLGALNEALTSDLPALNDTIHRLDVPAIVRKGAAVLGT